MAQVQLSGMAQPEGPEVARRSLGDRGATLFDTRVEFREFTLACRIGTRSAAPNDRRFASAETASTPHSEDSIDIAEEFRRTELRDDCKVDYKRPGRSLTDETMVPGRAPKWKTRANIQVDFLRSNV